MNQYDKKRKAVESGTVRNSVKKSWRGATNHVVEFIPITTDHSNNGTAYYGSANNTINSSSYSYRDGSDSTTQWDNSTGAYRRPATVAGNEYKAPATESDSYTCNDKGYHSYWNHNNGYVNGNYRSDWGEINSNSSSSYPYNSSESHRPPSNRSNTHYLDQPKYDPHNSSENLIDSHHSRPNNRGFIDLATKYRDISSILNDTVESNLSNTSLPFSSSSVALPPTTSPCHNKYSRTKKDTMTKLVSQYKPRLYSFGNKKGSKQTNGSPMKSPKASSAVKDEPATSVSQKDGGGEAGVIVVESEKRKVIQSDIIIAGALLSASEVRALLDVRIALLDYHTQLELMKLGLAPDIVGRRPKPIASNDNDNDAVADAILNASIDDVVAKENGIVTSKGSDTVSDQTINSSSKYIPPPPLPAVLKKSLKRSESDAFTIKSNSNSNQGLSLPPSTIKRTVSLPTREALLAKSPPLRRFIMEMDASNPKPNPPTSTPPIPRASANRPALPKEDSLPPLPKDPPPPSPIDTRSPPTSKKVMPVPPKSKTKGGGNNLISKGMHDKAITSIPNNNNSSKCSNVASMPPVPPKTTTIQPPKGPPSQVSATQNLLPKAIIPPPPTSHPKDQHNQIPPKGHHPIPQPPKRTAHNPQIPLPPNGPNKPLPPKSNDHPPPTHKYSNQPPPPKSNSYPPAYSSRLTSSDRASPLGYVANDFTHSDFDDYSTTSGRDLSRHPYRRNDAYGVESWNDPKCVFNTSVRDYHGASNYDPYYYPPDDAIDYGPYDHQSRRDYIGHHGTLYPDDGIHYYVDPSASRYYMSIMEDPRSFAVYDYDRIQRGDYSVPDNHSFTPTYRSRSPVPLHTGSYSSSSNTSMTPSAKSGAVRHDKNAANNSNSSSSAGPSSHKAKKASPQVVPPPAPPRRPNESSPVLTSVLKTPR